MSYKRGYYKGNQVDNLYIRNINLIENNTNFDITSLFANNEDGFYYDCTDTSTIFNDRASQNEIVNSQTLSVLVDKTRFKTLGSNITLDADFEKGLVGFKTDSAGSVSEYLLNTINPISGTKDAIVDITTVGTATNRPLIYYLTEEQRPGQYYELSFDYKVISGEPIFVGVNLGNTAVTIRKNMVGQGKIVCSYIRDSDTNLERVYLYFGQNIGKFQIDNIQLKPILGNSASQITTSKRPLFNSDGIVFDNVDDELNVIFKNNLQNCTIITATKSNGVVVETGRNINKEYIINTNFHQKLLINRLLTTEEISKVTRYFENKVGTIQ